jgi:hypothetical protein
MGDLVMSQIVSRVAEQDEPSGPDVEGLGAWFTSAKELRRELADYVPKHRAAGPAV